MRRWWNCGPGFGVRRSAHHHQHRDHRCAPPATAGRGRPRGLRARWSPGERVGIRRARRRERGARPRHPSPRRSTRRPPPAQVFSSPSFSFGRSRPFCSTSLRRQARCGPPTRRSRTRSWSSFTAPSRSAPHPSSTPSTASALSSSWWSARASQCACLRSARGGRNQFVARSHVSSMLLHRSIPIAGARLFLRGPRLASPRVPSPPPART